MSQPKSKNIKVVVRCCTSNSKEKEKGHKPIVHINSNKREVSLFKSPDDPDWKTFRFNSCYQWDVTQQLSTTSRSRRSLCRTRNSPGDTTSLRRKRKSPTYSFRVWAD